jgi:hypothetical protein
MGLNLKSSRMRTKLEKFFRDAPRRGARIPFVDTYFLALLGFGTLMGFAGIGFALLERRAAGARKKLGERPRTARAAHLA